MYGYDASYKCNACMRAVSGRSEDTYMQVGNTTQQGRSVKASESLLKRMQTRYWIQGVS